MDGTAAHEAAHAVAAALLGGIVLGASIRRDQVSCGRTEFVMPDGTEWIVVTLCGPLARLKAAGWSGNGSIPWFDGGGEDHIQEAKAMAELLAGDDQARSPEILEGMVADAWALLDFPDVWAAIHRVAEALVMWRELDGSEIERLIDDAFDDPEVEAAMARYRTMLDEAKAKLIALQARLDQIGARLRDQCERREKL